MNRRSFVAAAAATVVFPRSVRADAAYWEKVVRDAAARHGVSGDWLAATVACESGFRPDAYNHRTGDCGLAQFNPATWDEFCGYRNLSADIWDGHANADMAAWGFANGYAHRWCCSGVWQGGPCQ